jgi:hypothetical protein
MLSNWYIDLYLYEYIRNPNQHNPKSSQECGYYKDVYSVGAQGEIVYKYLQDLFCNSTSCICPDAPDNPGESAPIHITFTCV